MICWWLSICSNFAFRAQDSGSLELWTRMLGMKLQSKRQDVFKSAMGKLHDIRWLGVPHFLSRHPQCKRRDECIHNMFCAIKLRSCWPWYSNRFDQICCWPPTITTKWHWIVTVPKFLSSGGHLMVRSCLMAGHCKLLVVYQRGTTTLRRTLMTGSSSQQVGSWQHGSPAVCRAPQILRPIFWIPLPGACLQEFCKQNHANSVMCNVSHGSVSFQVFVHRSSRRQAVEHVGENSTKMEGHHEQFNKRKHKNSAAELLVISVLRHCSLT